MLQGPCADEQTLLVCGHVWVGRVRGVVEDNEVLKQGVYPLRVMFK